MAKIEGTEVVASIVGPTDWIHLGPGEWVLHVTSTGWGDAKVEIADGAADRWSDLTLPAGGSSITANVAVRVPGNNSYRLNATTIPNAIRMRAVAPS